MFIHCLGVSNVHLVIWLFARQNFCSFEITHKLAELRDSLASTILFKFVVAG